MKDALYLIPEQNDPNIGYPSPIQYKPPLNANFKIFVDSNFVGEMTGALLNVEGVTHVSVIDLPTEEPLEIEGYEMRSFVGNTKPMTLLVVQRSFAWNLQETLARCCDALEKFILTLDPETHAHQRKNVFLVEREYGWAAARHVELKEAYDKAHIDLPGSRGKRH